MVQIINFNLPQYEWQKDMNIIIQDASINKIKFLSANSILFSFTDIDNGNDHKNLICNNIWKQCGEYNFEKGDDFPIFIGDVRTIKLINASDVKAAFDYLNYSYGIPVSSGYNLVCIDSGEVSVTLICETVLINQIKIQ